MGVLEVVIYSLLCMEMVEVMVVVLVRRYFSARWQRKFLAPSDQFRLIKNAIGPLVVLSMLSIDNYRRVKKLDSQTSRRGAIDHITRLQYNADKAFAQRNMYLNLFGLYLAALIWLVLEIKDEPESVVAARPENRSPDSKSTWQFMAKKPARDNTSTAPLIIHQDPPTLLPRQRLLRPFPRSHVPPRRRKLRLLLGQRNLFRPTRLALYPWLLRMYAQLLIHQQTLILILRLLPQKALPLHPNPPKMNDMIMCTLHVMDLQLLHKNPLSDGHSCTLFKHIKPCLLVAFLLFYSRSTTSINQSTKHIDSRNINIKGNKHHATTSTKQITTMAAHRCEKCPLSTTDEAIWELYNQAHEDFAGLEY